MKNKKKIVTIIEVLVLVVSIAAIAFAIVHSKKPTTTAEPTAAETTTEAAPSNFNPLTGEANFNADFIGKRPIAITIQNSNDYCRPQWGLCDADIVIEGEVEGMGTKYLWLFSDWTKAEKCGPFRSVRRDFVELAMGFDAVLVHCGWSSGTAIGAAEYLNSTGYTHLGSCAVWGKVSPSGSKNCGQEYKSYTSYDIISKAANKANIRTETESTYLKPLSFYESATALPGGTCSSITFKIGFNTATFTWKDGAYYGAYKDITMKDNDGTLYSVANVVVLYLNSINVVDAKGRVDMDLSSGTGVLASNGTYMDITWTKGDGADMIKLYDKDGKEAKLNVGKTYIALARLSTAELTEITA